MRRRSLSKKKHALVLLSGGLDSSACAAFYLTQKFSVQALFVNYGQISAARECSAAAAICAHYGIPLEKLTCSGFSRWKGGYIPGRNAFLLYSALMAFRHATGIIAMGIHAGTSYQDCSERFTHDMQSSFDLYADGRIRIAAPFLRWSKRQILDYSKKHNVPVQLTYSCELGVRQPCGRCLSCKDLKALYAR